MHQYENAEPDVVTSAPPIDLGDTWTGCADEARQVDVLRIQLAQAHTALENAQHLEREQRARADALAAKLAHSDAHGLLYENSLEFLSDICLGEQPIDARLLEDARSHAKAAGIHVETAVRQVATVRAAISAGAHARARIADLEADLTAERARAAACISRGLSAVPTDDLIAEVQRRGFARPVPAASVPVARDDAGDDARQDAPERLG